VARYRSVYVEIWDDPDFQKYTPSGKLTFIYLFTNYKIGESGIYVITSETIARATGVSKKTVEKLLMPIGEHGRCAGLKNVFYDWNNYAVFLAKYRIYNAGGNPAVVAKAIENERKKIDSPLWGLFDKYYSRVGQPLRNGYIELDIDIDLGIEIENGATMDEAKTYYIEKLGYELGTKMESVIYDFKSTRKTGRLAPGVVKGIVDYWLKFSHQLLLEAKGIWDEQRYAHEGKDEKYFNGILRRLAKEIDIRRASQVGAHR